MDKSALNKLSNPVNKLTKSLGYFARKLFSGFRSMLIFGSLFFDIYRGTSIFIDFSKAFDRLIHNIFKFYSELQRIW